MKQSLSIYLNLIVAAQRLNTEEDWTPVSPVEDVKDTTCIISLGFIFLPEEILNGVIVLGFQTVPCCTFLLVSSVFMCLKSIFLSGCLRPTVALYCICPSALLFSHSKGFVPCRPTEDHTARLSTRQGRKISDYQQFHKMIGPTAKFTTFWWSKYKK